MGKAEGSNEVLQRKVPKYLAGTKWKGLGIPEKRTFSSDYSTSTPTAAKQHRRNVRSHIGFYMADPVRNTFDLSWIRLSLANASMRSQS